MSPPLLGTTSQGCTSFHLICGRDPSCGLSDPCASLDLPRTAGVPGVELKHTMPHSLAEPFRAFELLDEDEPMRGFQRVACCALRDFEALYRHEAFGFERPFDVRFAKAVVKTAAFLVGTDSEVRYGFAEHGVISLLLAPAAQEGPETSRQILTRLASHAGSQLGLILGDLALFDVRLYQFPSPELVRAYFLWRQEIQRTDTLNRHVIHALTQSGQDEDTARSILADLGEDEKLEILSQHEVSFEELPIWQRRGTGCYWRAGIDDEPPVLMVDSTLPIGKMYADYLTQFL